METILNKKESDSPIFTLEWDEIENEEIDYDLYLDDLENFFREDFENDCLEEEGYLE